VMEHAMERVRRILSACLRASVTSGAASAAETGGKADAR